LPPEYCWDEDGLWVDNLLGNPDLTATNNRLDLYQLSSEPWFIDVQEAPNGNVYFYGNWENHVRIFEISGWNNWVKKSGPVVTTGTLQVVSVSNQQTITKVYPNPAKDFITIEGVNENALFNVYNITGSLVLSIPIDKDKIIFNIAELKPNIYIYKIISGSNTLQTGKLAKE
jgi:hypothetical protein